ncbi:ATP-grasp domain-containing protein [Flagellimonas abyssi]|nr:ATP-grasp domain-containing protein [Allomuricauda abyssi]
MREKIAIIGASYLQLPLVEKARQMGIETHCFAWKEGAMCEGVADFFYPISVLDKERILEICSAIKIKGITTIATDIAIPTVSYVGEKLGLCVNSYESAICSTNKLKMRLKFVDFNVNSPKFWNIKSGQVEKLTPNFPVIVKPVDRSGSRGVTKVNDKYELSEAINEACKESLTGACIVEEFIDGIEVSVESISWKGNHYVLAITDKITTGAPNFVELSHHQPTMCNEEVKRTLEDETKKALTSVGVENGAGHTEFKITKNGSVYIIEVGARMGGDFIGSHLVELSTGYDFLEGVINVALDRFDINSIRSSNNNCSGVYFLSKETERLLPFFERKNMFDVEKSIMGKELLRIKNSNDRSGYLIYKAKERVLI